jgi:type VI secretion system protein ImpF
MAPPAGNQELVRSVLDRLLVDGSESAAGAVADLKLSSTLARIKEDVRRDLEWLLNTRRALDGPLDELGPLERSLWTYGLPDFTNLTLQAAAQRGFLEMIRRAIELFDPRLSDVAVTLGSLSQQPQALNYEISALLQVEPKPVEVKFDSSLELSTKKFTVQDA